MMFPSHWSTRWDSGKFLGFRSPAYWPLRPCWRERRCCAKLFLAVTCTPWDQMPSPPATQGSEFRRTILAVYMLSGAAAGLAAIVMTSWVSAAQPLAGEGMELQSLAAVVVGGVALAGGAGTMLQAFWGVLVLGLLSNALNMAGVSSFLQTLVVGIVILLAVIIDRLRAV